MSENLSNEERRERAAALRALPDGTEVWRGSMGYVKRGDWRPFGSPGGDRMTSNDLVVIGFSVADVKEADQAFAEVSRAAQDARDAALMAAQDARDAALGACEPPAVSLAKPSDTAPAEGLARVAVELGSLDGIHDSGEWHVVDIPAEVLNDFDGEATEISEALMSRGIDRGFRSPVVVVHDPRGNFPTGCTTCSHYDRSDYEVCGLHADCAHPPFPVSPETLGHMVAAWLEHFDGYAAAHEVPLFEREPDDRRECVAKFAAEQNVTTDITAALAYAYRYAH